MFGASIMPSDGGEFKHVPRLPGREAELIATLVDCAEDKDLNFTWLDVLLILTDEAVE